MGDAVCPDEKLVRRLRLGVRGVLVTSPLEYMNFGDGRGEGTGRSDAE